MSWRPVVEPGVKFSNSRRNTMTKAEQIKAVMALTARNDGYRGESRLWKIHDLRKYAGLDYQTAKTIVDDPTMILFLYGD
jgi:hypothetical protein